jgi:hypothetical protein
MNQQDAFKELHCGVTFGFYARNGYFSTKAAKEEIDAIVACNVKWIALTPTVMQEAYCATRQFRDFENTPDDFELTEMINYIHSKGIKVQLRPMLECFDGQGRNQVWFPPDRERIPGKVSDYWSKWFQSMTLRSVHYAKLAQRTGCELFGLDSELDKTVDKNAEWKQVIQRVREVYDGPITSCHTREVDFLRAVENKNHWFYDLDMLSISFYYKGAEHPDSTVEEMVECLKEPKEYCRKIAEIYGKPFFFGECGCTSSQFGARSPSGWSSKAAYCGEEQSNYLEAILKSFWNEPWWYGLYWWKWDEQNDRKNFYDPAGDKGFIVKGKPASNLMREWFDKKDTVR